jgi:hypothetical protein
MNGKKNCEPGIGVRGKGAAFEPPFPAHLFRREGAGLFSDLPAICANGQQEAGCIVRAFRGARLRPEPGSRVVFTPAHTQGAGVPFAVRPPKARVHSNAKD